MNYGTIEGMSVRYATIDEVAHWDDFILSQNGGNIFASKTYGEIKKHGGYTPRYIMVGAFAVSVLEKNTPLGRWWYLPKGPLVGSPKELLSIIKSLTPFARSKGIFMIKIESELDASCEADLTKAGMLKAKPVIPNASTITLDISPAHDALLASLPQKGRHAIKRAERDGVMIKAVDTRDEHCKTMYALLSETAEGRFGLRPYSYYERYWRLFAEAGQGQLFFAEFEGRVVAGAYAMVYGEKSTYKDGASVRDRTAYGASHLLQWHVITWAKEHGARLHDFCGSPPSDRINDESHPHYGIGRFKQSFSKQVVDYIGCYDVVIQPTAYRLWRNIGERVAHKLFYLRRHDYYY